MKLFILGNGFDLAHGIQTKYSDFRDFLEDKHSDFLYNFERNYNISFTELWKDFEGNLSAIDDQQIFDGAMASGDITDDYDSGTDDGLGSFLDEEYRYIKDLQTYIKEWAENIDINVNKVFKRTLWNQNDLCMTFNYTMVLENLYNIDNSNILHIHGSVDEFDISPIIGHGNVNLIEDKYIEADEAENDFKPKEASAYNAIGDYYKNTLKDVNKYIRDNKTFFENKIKDVDEIYIIGHSMGNVDLPYFTKIRENVKEDAVWKVVWHNIKDRKKFKDILIELKIPEQFIKTVSIKKCKKRVKFTNID